MTKTVALVELLKTMLEPFLPRIELAFVFGSVAKDEDTAASDIDLMIISGSLTYADVFPCLEKASVGMGRAIQPSLYPREGLCKRISTKCHTCACTTQDMDYRWGSELLANLECHSRRTYDRAEDFFPNPLMVTPCKHVP